MKRGRRGALPARAEEAREGIDRWRQTRKKRSPMPEELWVEAVALAQAHGVYRISQALGVNYETLRARLQSTKASTPPPTRKRIKALKAKREPKTRFAVLPAAPAMAAMPAPGQVVVEMLDGSAKLTIILNAEANVDVCALVTAFRGGQQRGCRR